MVEWFMRCAMIAFVIVVLFGTSSSLLVTFGKRGKSSSNVQLQNNTDEPCTTDEDCSTLPNTSCIQTDMGNSECRCQDLEPPRFGQCIVIPKDLQVACGEDQDCARHGIVDKSIECRNYTCHCKVGYFPNPDMDSCEESVSFDAIALGVLTNCNKFLMLVSSITVFYVATAFW